MAMLSRHQSQHLTCWVAVKDDVAPVRPSETRLCPSLLPLRIKHVEGRLQPSTAYTIDIDSATKEGDLATEPPSRVPGIA
jgi:hypothetical protein